MKAEERRRQILIILSERRSTKINNLAFELTVSRRTIINDLFELSLYYPIYTVSGRYGGGVYVDKDWSLGKKYLTSQQEAVLKLLKKNLEGENQKVLEAIINNFSKKAI